MLGRRGVRDIVYEDHGGYPSAVGELLEGYGFRIFLIRKGLRRPLLLDPSTPRYELPNFLATLDPDRALRLASKRGYSVL